MAVTTPCRKNLLRKVLLLNFSQCKLSEGDFYAVVEHCTTVLKIDPDNVKAPFWRTQAQVAASQKDQRVLELDDSSKKAVQKELDLIEELQYFYLFYTTYFCLGGVATSLKKPGFSWPG